MTPEGDTDSWGKLRVFTHEDPIYYEDGRGGVFRVHSVDDGVKYAEDGVGNIHPIIAGPGEEGLYKRVEDPTVKKTSEQ